MNQIIGNAKEYNSQYYSSLPKPLEDPKTYFDSLIGLSTIIENKFPLLRLCFLPTKQPKTAFIQGILLPTYAIEEKCLDKEEYKEYGLYIFANIPENYQVDGIRVYDACKRINWDNIPIEYRHCVPLNIISPEDENKRYICTHHKKDISSGNCIINVLSSAYFLFEEYRRYERTGEFRIKCLPHDIKAEV